MPEMLSDQFYRRSIHVVVAFNPTCGSFIGGIVICKYATMLMSHEVIEVML